MTQTAGISAKLEPKLNPNSVVLGINGTIERLTEQSKETLVIINSRNFILGEVFINHESGIKTYNMMDANGHYRRAEGGSSGAIGELVSTEIETPFGIYKGGNAKLVYLLGLVADGDDTRIMFSHDTTLDYAGEIFPLVKTVSTNKNEVLQTFEDKILRGDGNPCC